MIKPANKVIDRNYRIHEMQFVEAQMMTTRYLYSPSVTVCSVLFVFPQGDDPFCCCNGLYTAI